MPASRPVLAVRAELKSTVAVTVDTNVAAELGLRKDDTDPHVPQRATALASFESGPSPAALTALSR
jgi:hypothetical protein